MKSTLQENGVKTIYFQPQLYPDQFLGLFWEDKIKVHFRAPHTHVGPNYCNQFSFRYATGRWKQTRVPGGNYRGYGTQNYLIGQFKCQKHVHGFCFYFVFVFLQDSVPALTVLL